MSSLKKVKIVLPYACTYDGPMPDTTFVKKIDGGWMGVHEFGTRTFKLGVGQKVPGIASAGGHAGIFPLFFPETAGGMHVSPPNPAATYAALSSVGFTNLANLRSFCGPQPVTLDSLIQWQASHCEHAYRGLQVVGVRIDGELPVVPAVLATLLLSSSRSIGGIDPGPYGPGRFMFLFMQEDAKGVSLALAYFGKPILLSAPYFSEELIPRYLWPCYNLPHVATSIALHEIAVSGRMGGPLLSHVRGPNGFSQYLGNFPTMKDAFSRYRLGLLQNEYLANFIEVVPNPPSTKKGKQAEPEEESIHGL